MAVANDGIRVARGRVEVVREVRTAGPLLAAVRVPVTAKPPWLTAVLNLDAAHRRLGSHPVAVVVDPPDGAGAPLALATLVLHGSGPRVTATLLGDGLPVPAGAAPARLPARDDAAAERLAAGVVHLLDRLRRPWRLRLTGLPLGDPTLRAIGRLRPEAAFANARSARLIDGLDEVGPVRRTRDAAELERWLPQLLARATHTDRSSAPRRPWRAASIAGGVAADSSALRRGPRAP